MIKKFLTNLFQSDTLDLVAECPPHEYESWAIDVENIDEGTFLVCKICGYLPQSDSHMEDI